MRFVEDEVGYIGQEPGLDGMFGMIERAARICYRTENLIREGSAESLIENVLIPSGHTSVLEFGTVYLKFSVFCPWDYLKYVSDRYSRVEFYGSGVYVTTTYRTIMQGGYSDPIEAIGNGFDRNWKDDLDNWCEPTEFHHRRRCFRFVMDRAGSQSVMRHRGVYGISYAQESTRFCNYSKDRFGGEVLFSLPSKFGELVREHNTREEIGKHCKKPVSFDLEEWPLEKRLSFIRKVSPEWKEYEKSLKQSEKSYLNLTSAGWKAEDARGVLGLDLKTEFMMCAYDEDWDMFLFRRLSRHAHPHVRRVAETLMGELEKLGAYIH